MRIRIILIKIYYILETHYFLFLELLFSPKKFDYKTIPIIINNRNRLTYLKKLIKSLEKRGYFNIIILDNDSSFEPLLNYYKNECKYRICFLNANLGHLALWKSKYFNEFKYNYYVYTDSDLELTDECPENFIQDILTEMKFNKYIQKIGLSLRTDNLPDYYDLKQEVIDWEKRFYEKKYNRNKLFFIAQVDTTFAVYRPFVYGGSSDYHLTLRTSYPLMISHLPWYVDSKNLTIEEKFYIQNASSSTFWTKNSLH